MNIGELSQTLATDATTLNRNIEVLIKYGLVEDAKNGEDERVRNVQATPTGKTKYEEALPLWQQAQSAVLENVGQDKWVEMMHQLQKVEGTWTGKV